MEQFGTSQMLARSVLFFYISQDPHSEFDRIQMVLGFLSRMQLGEFAACFIMFR
jgi:hypothetical protein